jgi:polyphosphate glucokinase
MIAADLRVFMDAGALAAAAEREVAQVLRMAVREHASASIALAGRASRPAESPMTRVPSQASRGRRANARADPRTLALDVGGTGLKAAILDAKGNLISDRVRAPTPARRSPVVLVQAVVDLVAPLGAYDRVSVGFPGVVRDGVVRTAPNFASGRWRGFDLARALIRSLNRPVRVLNDADVHGLAVIAGRGVELVITLGTGVGSAFFRDGILMPHLELSQHPVHDGRTYDEYLGDRARKRVGRRKWNRRVHRVLGILETVFNFDRLYIGGGNAARINGRLGRRVRVVDNTAGLLGGVALWR